MDAIQELQQSSIEQRPVDAAQALIAILGDMTRDWDTGFEGRITGETRLMNDLQFASIDLVALIVKIEELYERRDWPFEDLLMVDGRYVEDLTVNEIAAFLNQHSPA